MLLYPLATGDTYTRIVTTVVINIIHFFGHAFNFFTSKRVNKVAETCFYQLRVCVRSVVE